MKEPAEAGWHCSLGCVLNDGEKSDILRNN